MTRYACPACRAVLEAEEQPAGMLMTCPGCQRTLRVPAPTASEAVRTSPAQLTPTTYLLLAAPPAHDIPPTLTNRSFHRSQFKDLALVVCLLLGVGIVLSGCFLLGWAGTEAYETSGASEEPQEIALADLMARGTRGNPNVLVTDFAAGEPWDEVKAPTPQTDSFSSCAMWLPLLPVSGGTVEQKVGAVVYCPEVNRQGQVFRQCDRGQLQGLVRSTLPVPAPISRSLQRRYRETDMEHCLVIEAGRKPAELRVVLAATVGGVALLLVGSAVFLLPLLSLVKPALVGQIGARLLLFLHTHWEVPPPG